MKWAKQSGFTIVELLIVVVVIAILAAITIVSYNGITARANDTAVQNDLKQLATKVELFRAENSRIPRGDSELAALGLSVSKSSYGVLFTNSSTDYNLLYCSPSDTEYSFIARSKSGNAFQYGTSGVSTFSSGSTSTVTLCSAAGVPTSDTASTSRVLLYGNGWQSWVGGSS